MRLIVNRNGSLQIGVALLISASLSCLLSGCGPGMVEAYTPKELAALLDAAGGWHLLIIPDTKYEVGSEITITEAAGVRWIGRFSSCQVPAETIAPIPGHAPAMDYKKAIAFDGSAALNVSGISVGPEYSKVKTVAMKLDAYGTDAIDIQKLNLWLTDLNHAPLPPACMAFFQTPRNYLVNEAFHISKGKFTLYDKDDKKISLSNETVGKYLGSVRAGLSVTTDGSVEFSDGVYVLAVRIASYSSTGFTVLSGTQKDHGDPEEARTWQRVISGYPGK